MDFPWGQFFFVTVSGMIIKLHMHLDDKKRAREERDMRIWALEQAEKRKEREPERGI